MAQFLQEADELRSYVWVLSLILLIVAATVLVGCDSKERNVESISAPIIEHAIRLDESTYVLVPVTLRVMPVAHLVSTGKRFESLQALAEAISPYPMGSIVYVAEPGGFSDPDGRLTSLTVDEIAEIRLLILDAAVELKNGEGKY